MTNFIQSLRIFLWLTLLTGIIYPLAVTLIGYLTMHNLANGQLVNSDGKIKGSFLIGQKFESEKYFWSRPSAVDYTPLPSGGSNLGPTSAQLKKNVLERKAKISAGTTNQNNNLPADLLYASGSGLDPHITPKAALFQMNRIAQARNLPKETVAKLIEDFTEKSPLDLFGPPIINVLKINLALDQLDHLTNK